MGYSKLTYDEFEEDRGYWLAEGVTAPRWADELAAKGYKSVSAIDFYDDVFGEDLAPHRLPEDYRTGEYCAIALEIDDKKIIKDGKEELVRKTKRHFVTQDLDRLFDLIDSKKDNFCLIAPVSYAGRTRENKNARYLYALTVEVDDIQPKNGLEELIYSWERENKRMPKPTYIVCSGNGLHLYFVFERPIPLWPNIMKQFIEVKTYLTKAFWNKYVTSSYEKVQYESVCQAFRCVGSKAKKNSYAMAFQTGEKITIEYLNKLLPDKLQMNTIYKSKMSKEEAKELYPDWYQRRVEKGEPKGHFSRYEGIYYNWIQKIKDGAEVGHRYNCLENLCSLAVQCCIAPNQVEKDCRDLAAYLETLTVSEDNHFTEYDIISALRTYHNARISAYERNIDYITNKTGIKLDRVRRNRRNQAEHLKRARALQFVDYPNAEWRNKDGRPVGSGTKEQLVKEWIAAHPDGSATDAARELGISRTTFYKYR